MQKTILAIEDDPQIGELLELLLTSPEIRLLHYTSGREGYEAILQHKPHLVLLDVKVPEMTGWEVMDAVRGNPEVQGIPIIMLSVSQPEEVERRQMFTRSLINFFIPKPFDILELRRRIKTILDVTHWEIGEKPATPAPGSAGLHPIGDKLKAPPPASPDKTSSGAGNTKE